MTGINVAKARVLGITDKVSKEKGIPFYVYKCQYVSDDVYMIFNVTTFDKAYAVGDIVPLCMTTDKYNNLKLTI